MTFSTDRPIVGSTLNRYTGGGVIYQTARCPISDHCNLNFHRHSNLNLPLEIHRKFHSFIEIADSHPV